MCVHEHAQVSYRCACYSNAWRPLWTLESSISFGTLQFRTPVNHQHYFQFQASEFNFFFFFFLIKSSKSNGTFGPSGPTGPVNPAAPGGPWTAIYRLDQNFIYCVALPRWDFKHQLGKLTTGPARPLGPSSPWDINKRERKREKCFAGLTGGKSEQRSGMTFRTKIAWGLLKGHGNSFRLLLS